MQTSTCRKRGPYNRRLHQPLFELAEKTTTKQGKTAYQKLYMRAIRSMDKNINRSVHRK
jgi:hypothetical protein